MCTFVKKMIAMKKLFHLTVALLPLLALAGGCGLPDPGQQIYTAIAGVYMIEGGTPTTPAILSHLDYNTRSVTRDIFRQQNGKSLTGRVPDALSFGNHLCICAQDAGVVYVTDLFGKIEREISAAEQGANQPSHIILEKENLFVTYADGFLARIDTATFTVTVLTLPDKPQGLAASNNQIFVACPGATGFGTTIAVVEARSFAAMKSMSVSTNPSELVACGKSYLYVLFKGANSGIEVFDTEKNESLATVGVQSPIAISTGYSSYFFALTRETDGAGNIYQRIVPVDGYTARPEMQDLNRGDVILDSAVTISVDPINGMIFVGSTKDDGSGKYEIFTPQGGLWHTLNTTETPGKVFFATTQVVY